MLTDDQAIVNEIPRLDKDPRVDLSLVIATSLLRLAGFYRGLKRGQGPSLADIEVPRFLQAVVLLDSQLLKTPSEVPLRLLLVQLYLRLGCPSIAYRLWGPLDVKRTIQDALSPLFFDRISSIAPSLFQGSGRQFTEGLRSYYSFRDPSATRIWDAFLDVSYNSVLSMAEFNDHLRKGCTRVMAVIEERRAARAFGAKMDDLDDVPVFGKLLHSQR